MVSESPLGGICCRESMAAEWIVSMAAKKLAFGVESREDGGASSKQVFFPLDKFNRLVFPTDDIPSTDG